MTVLAWIMNLDFAAGGTVTVVTGGSSAMYSHIERRRNQIDPQPLMIKLEPQRG